MFTVVVTLAGDSLVSVRLVSVSTEPPADEAEAETEPGVVDEVDAEIEAAEAEAEAEVHEEADEGPSPITPELKEMAWGAGAFIVLAVGLRYFIYPRLRAGMTRRYESIQQGFTDADALRESAQGEVAAYQTALAGVRAEAAARLDAARQTLEAERQARLTEVNAGIADRRAAAAAQTEAARQAAEGHVNEAVGSVASRLVEIVTGNQPSAEAVQSAVESTTSAGVR